MKRDIKCYSEFLKHSQLLENAIQITAKESGLPVKHSITNPPMNSSHQSQDFLKIVTSTVYNAIGVSESTGFDIKALSAYISQVFQTHVDAESIVNSLVPHKTAQVYLNVDVIAARNLEAKDVNGFSDPYCILGIIPGCRITEGDSPEFTDTATVSPNSKRKGSAHDAVMESSEAGKLSEGRLSGARASLRRLSHSIRRRGNNDGNALPNSTDTIQPKRLLSLKSAQIPVKVLQYTDVKPHTLNPVWDESFQFELDNRLTDKLHLDIWDHDEETSVMDAVFSLNEVRGMRQLGRYFKQVGQSARKGQGGDLDDFLGCTTVEIRDIPASGLKQWFKLAGHSNRSKVQGDVHLGMQFSTVAKNESPTRTRMPEVLEYSQLLDILLKYERDLHVSLSADWDGSLSQYAEFIHSQYALQNGLNNTLMAICRWSCFARLFCASSIDCDLMAQESDKLISSWNRAELSQEHLDHLTDSLTTFTAYALHLVVHCDTAFTPGYNNRGLKELEALLGCLNKLHNSRAFQNCLPFSNSVNSDIISGIKSHLVERYEKLRSVNIDQIAAEKNQTVNFVHQTLKKYSFLITSVNQHLERFHRVYAPIFESQLGIDLIAVMNKCYTNLICRDLLYSGELSQLVSDLFPTEEFRKLSLTATEPCGVSQSENAHSDCTLSVATQTTFTELIVLYHSVKQFESTIMPPNSESFTEDEEVNWYSWFQPALQLWVALCEPIMNDFAEAAVKNDEFYSKMNSLGSAHSGVVCSESAISLLDNIACMVHIYNDCEWALDREKELQSNCTLHVIKVVYRAVSFCARQLNEKLRLQGYCDEEGQFDIADQLCIGLNNLELMLEFITLPAGRAGIPTDPGQKKQPHQLPSASPVCTRQPVCQLRVGLERLITRCPLVCQVKEIVQSGVDEVEKILGIILCRVSAKMRPEIRKNVYHLCWTPTSAALETAFHYLRIYLEANLNTLDRRVSPNVCKLCAMGIWTECLKQFIEQVNKEAEIGPNASGPGAFLNPRQAEKFYGMQPQKSVVRTSLSQLDRASNANLIVDLPSDLSPVEVLKSRSTFLKLKEALYLLSDIFIKNTGCGLAKHDLEGPFYQDVHYMIDLYLGSTSQIIEAFLQEKLTEQELATEAGVGQICVAVQHVPEENKLIVKVNSASNLLPLDSNGASDPFVIVELLPRHGFSVQPKPLKTRVIRNTLNPVFHESFDFQVTSAELCGPAVCLAFVVMDYDLLLTNDFEGSAFLRLGTDVQPESTVTPNAAGSTASQPRWRTLPLIRSPNSKFRSFEILGRRSDAYAQEVYKRWQTLDTGIE